MNRVKWIVIIAVLLLFGCDRIARYSGSDVLASVGEKVLLKADIESLFTQDITPQDSIKLLESYVDMWVRKQLKIVEAERLFSEANESVETMVEEYRSSLLSHKLDQYFYEQRLDTLFTEQEIQHYYSENRGDFMLDRTLIKGRVVELPDNYRDKKRLKELMQGSAERYQDFVEISNKNKFNLHEFDTWTDLADLITILPVGKRYASENIVGAKGVVELKDGDSLYYVHLTETLQPGDISPLERVREAIKRVLLNNRKRTIVHNYEDSLYNVALKSGGARVRKIE